MRIQSNTLVENLQGEGGLHTHTQNIVLLVTEQCVAHGYGTKIVEKRVVLVKCFPGIQTGDIPVTS